MKIHYNTLNHTHIAHLDNKKPIKKKKFISLLIHFFRRYKIGLMADVRELRGKIITAVSCFFGRLTK
jgi:hypothetical protein